MITLRQYTERWVAARAKENPTVDTVRAALEVLAEQAKRQESQPGATT